MTIFLNKSLTRLLQIRYSVRFSNRRVLPSLTHPDGPLEHPAPFPYPTKKSCRVSATRRKFIHVHDLAPPAHCAFSERRGRVRSGDAGRPLGRCLVRQHPAASGDLPAQGGGCRGTAPLR